MNESEKKLNHAMSANAAEEIGWNDEIAVSAAAVVLPDGNYDFTVYDLKRGRHLGSKKVPACNKATLTLCFESDEGCAYVKKDLFLASNMTWLLASFFVSVGLAKPGESFRMSWDNIIGLRGRAHLDVREYTIDGETRSANEITRFLPYDDTIMEAVDDEAVPF